MRNGKRGRYTLEFKLEAVRLVESGQSIAEAARDGALVAIDRCKVNLERVESVLVDGGYTGQPFADGVMERIEATVQVVKRNELHAFVVLPKRWIVERSFGWLEKCRRLWKNCERKLNTSLQMVHLAFLRLPLRRS